MAASVLIGSARINVEGKDAQFLQAMRRVGREFDKQDRKMRSLQRRTRALNTAFGRLKGGLLGIAAGAGLGGGLGGLARAASDATEKSSKLGATLVEISQASGTTVEALQAIRFAFESDGVAAEKADRAIGKVSKAFGEAQGGLKSYQKYFEQIGVDWERLSNTGASVETVFRAVADGLANTTDKFAVASSASILLGRDWQQITKAMQDGSAGLDRARSKLEELGALLSGRDALKLKALDQDMLNVASTMERKVARAVADHADDLSTVYSWWERLKGGAAAYAVEVVGAMARAATAITQGQERALAPELVSIRRRLDAGSTRQGSSKIASEYTDEDAIRRVEQLQAKTIKDLAATQIRLERGRAISAKVADSAEKRDQLERDRRYYEERLALFRKFILEIEERGATAAQAASRVLNPPPDPMDIGGLARGRRLTGLIPGTAEMAAMTEKRAVTDVAGAWKEYDVMVENARRELPGLIVLQRDLAAALKGEAEARRLVAFDARWREGRARRRYGDQDTDFSDAPDPRGGGPGYDQERSKEWLESLPRIGDAASKEAARVGEEMRASWERQNQVVMQAKDGFAGVFAGLASGKIAIDDLAGSFQNLAQDIAYTIVKQQILNSLLGGFGGGEWGSGAKGSGRVPIGHGGSGGIRAAGGMVSAGVAYGVNEFTTREVFVPRIGGRILPGDSGDGVGTISFAPNFQVDARGQDGPAAEAAAFRALAKIQPAWEARMMDLMNRSGRFRLTARGR